MLAATARVGRPRRALRPGEDPAKLAVRRLRDLERYYSDNPMQRWAKAAAQAAKKRARDAGVAFSITYHDVLRIAPARCPALGIPLDYSRGRVVIQADSPTVDKLRPELGYTPENIRVISNRANQCKSQAQPEELMAVARWHAQELAESLHG